MMEFLLGFLAYMICFGAFGGMVVIFAGILSFIDRIGNPYDKW